SCIRNLPLQLLALIFAGFIARAITKVEPPTSKKIWSRFQRAEEAARRLQEQYDRDAGNGPWDSRWDELRNWKETYENLTQIRRLRLQQMETETRKSQLDEFLNQFKINDVEIKGV